MPPVSLAPSIRSALRKITASDSRPSLANLCEGIGRFWDSDSDSDYEDLGEVEPRPITTLPSLQPGSNPTTTSGEATASTTPVPHRSRPETAAIRSSPPRRVQAPWKRVWRGPLPPRRISPPMTLADVLPPIRQRWPSSSGGGDLRTRPGSNIGGGDPHFAVHRDSKSRNQAGPASPRTGPKSRGPLSLPGIPTQKGTRLDIGSRRQPSTTSSLAAGPANPKRRLINTALFLDHDPKKKLSFRDALMAGGGHGRGFRGAAPGRGRYGRGRGPALAVRGGAPISGPERGGGRGQGHANRPAPPYTTAGGRGGGPQPAGAAGDRRPRNIKPAVVAGDTAPGGVRAGRDHEQEHHPEEPGHRPIGGGGDDQGKQKRKRKDTMARIECSICTEDHYTNQCPLLRGPKPTVAYCGAADDGTGFFQIQAARYNQIVNPIQSVVADLITVDSGEVTASLLRSELARVIPVRWEWNVQELDDKSFVVSFPSKEE